MMAAESQQAGGQWQGDGRSTKWVEAGSCFERGCQQAALPCRTALAGVAQGVGKDGERAGGAHNGPVRPGKGPQRQALVLEDVVVADGWKGGGGQQNQGADRDALRGVVCRKVEEPAAQGASGGGPAGSGGGQLRPARRTWRRRRSARAWWMSRMAAPGGGVGWGGGFGLRRGRTGPRSLCEAV